MRTATIRRARLLVGFGFAIGTLAACTGSLGESQSILPSTPPDGAAARDELVGMLGVDPVEGGCPYLEAADGTRYEVLYPDGWNVDRSSGALRNPAGNVVAGPGSVVTVRVREATHMASICQIGPIFQATAIVSIE